jgi:hypothetical protein
VEDVYFVAIHNNIARIHHSGHPIIKNLKTKGRLTGYSQNICKDKVENRIEKSEKKNVSKRWQDGRVYTSASTLQGVDCVRHHVSRRPRAEGLACAQGTTLGRGLSDKVTSAPSRLETFDPRRSFSRK